MGLVKKRFPQAQLAPYTSQEAMISGIINWRRNFTDTLKDFFGENTDADEILRFDTCINGFGMCSTSATECPILNNNQCIVFSDMYIISSTFSLLLHFLLRGMLDL